MLGSLGCIRKKPDPIQVWFCVINSATIYVVFRASRTGQIKARLAGKGCSLGKSRNAELAFS